MRGGWGLNRGFTVYEKGKKKDTQKEGGNVNKSATEVKSTQNFSALAMRGPRFWTKQKIPHLFSPLLDA